jgi:hypothetical protein
MRTLGHIATSFTVGTILYNYSRSYAAFLGFLITSVFIDLDHYIDYAREYGLSFNLKRVYGICLSPMCFKKLTLILHSYELMILVWLVVATFNLNIIWRYAAMGLIFHIFIDQITNPVLPSTYFFWFRMINNFETAKFLEKGVDYDNWNR